MSHNARPQNSILQQLFTNHSTAIYCFCVFHWPIAALAMVTACNIAVAIAALFLVHQQNIGAWFRWFR